MKIAHVADVHIGFGYPGPSQESRVNDIMNILTYIAATSMSRRAELLVFSGDAFKDANINLNRASKEIMYFSRWLRSLTTYGMKVIVISGTPSHDAIAAYEIIKEMNIPGVSVHTEPSTVEYKDQTFHLLPGLNRSQLMAQEEFKGLQPHEAHQLMTNKITDLCRVFALKPGILVSHITYTGSDNGFEDMLMQNEPVLTAEAAGLFEKVLLGHIHRPQQVGNVFYCGSPERLSFSDEHATPGFYIHDIDHGESEFVQTPARFYQTMEMDEDDVDAFIATGIAPMVRKEGAIIRVQYTCSEELNKRFDRKALEARLIASGAFYVQEIKGEIEHANRTRDKEVTEHIGPVKAVERWSQNQGMPPEEVSELCTGTAELLELLAGK